MRPRIREVIVVEGKYDKNTLSQLVDASIIETKGFGIFTDSELLLLLRRLAEARGVIVLTDSDGAGFVIRNRIKGSLPPDKVRHAYIPDVYGKEKRKSLPSREGKLGVEGMDGDTLLRALRTAGATFEGAEGQKRGGLTKADLYALGLSGGAGSSEKRRALLKKLMLPERLTSNALLDVLNSLFSAEELEEIMR